MGSRLSPMTAMPGTPIGRQGGLFPKRHGAVTTSTWAVWSPSPMTATLGTQIGRLVGPFPRRHGAARTSTWVAHERHLLNLFIGCLTLNWQGVMKELERL